MNFSKRAFTLLETVVAVSLVAIAATLILIEGRGIMADARQEMAISNAATLNFAMAEYRDYLSRGFRADTAWTAQSAPEVFTELRKPLRRGSKTVYALSSEQIDEATASTLVLSRNAADTDADYSPDCIWVPVANP